MIISKKPLAIAEAKAYVKDFTERKQLENYFRKFANLSNEDSEKLMKEIRVLNNPKIKEENIVKIADFLPKDMEDLGKIFNEITLNEEESNTILEIVKKY
ncbi:MAG: hypothetical protein AABW65_03705 [Nanoarchaeota archaeon]